MSSRLTTLLAVTTLTTCTVLPAEAMKQDPAPGWRASVSSLCQRADSSTATLGAATAAGAIEAGKSRCLSLNIPAAGLVLIGATVGGEGPVEPHLEVLSCPRDGRSTDVKPAALMTTPSERLIYAPEPGRLLACVGLQDDRDAASSAVIHSAFSPTGTSLRKRHPADPEKNQQIEIEPDGLVFAGDPAARRPHHDRADFDKNQQIEIEPDGQVLAGDPVAGLCSATGIGELDDHGDLSLCASPLRVGESAFGHSAGLLDSDVFAFELEELGRVALELSAPDQLELVLIDERGHRLARLNGGEPRRTKTLAAGLYFLMLSSDLDTPAEYRLLLSSAAR